MKLLPWRTLFSVALLSVVVATPTLGQDEGRRGGRGGQGEGGPGGRFGGGMFGGGMFGRGGDMALLGLLRVEPVQKELELTQEQIGKLDEVGPNLRDSDFDFRTATAEERTEYFENMNKKVTEQLEELLLPNQLERARQIALQTQGANALSDPAVAAKLNLSDEQKQKLETLQTEQREKMGTAMREAFQSGDREAVGEKMAELRKSALDEAKAVLNDEQKEQFQSMLGEPFEVSMQDMFRGGRGPGARGQGGRGPGGQGGPEGRGPGGRGNR